MAMGIRLEAQLDGSATEGVDCGVASTVMAIDYASGGKIRTTTERVRNKMGTREPTNPWDWQRAMRGFKDVADARPLKPRPAVHEHRGRRRDEQSRLVVHVVGRARAPRHHLLDRLLHQEDPDVVLEAALARVVERSPERDPTAQDDRRLQGVLARRREKSEAFFSSSAGEWDHLRGELFGDRVGLQAFVALADANWVVGDLGCGTGQMSATIAPYVARVIAIDGSAEMLGAARARLQDQPNVDLRQGALESLRHANERTGGTGCADAGRLAAAACPPRVRYLNHRAVLRGLRGLSRCLRSRKGLTFDRRHRCVERCIPQRSRRARAKRLATATAASRCSRPPARMTSTRRT